ncbi:hypothetical protein ACIU5I_11790 [Klebsiella pneumoniae]|uniref:hypothetical protein n=1 Tax=Klebsiella pneumoniae TaxID=573 RepID=UPI00384DAD99
MECSINWDALSAISTFVTMIVACVALYSWKNQEKLKVKLDFKNAVSAYAYCVMSFPSRLDNPFVRSNFKQKSLELSDLIAKAGWSWFATENILSRERVVVDAWQELNRLHGQFLDGHVVKENVIAQCEIIISNHFVFK